MPFPDQLYVKVGGKHDILTRPFRYVYANGIIKVPRGFRTDYASIPRVFRAFITGYDKTRMPAVIHDYMYREAIETRKLADDLFLKGMKETGVGWVKRHAMYLAVRGFAKGAY